MIVPNNIQFNTSATKEKYTISKTQKSVLSEKNKYDIEFLCFNVIKMSIIILCDLNSLR